MSGPKKPIYTTEAFGESTRDEIPPTLGERLKTSEPVDGVGDNDGIMNTNVCEPIYNYIPAQNDALVGKHDGSCQIVFGRDRPASLASGYGGKGAQGAGAIDIVVGRASSQALPDGSQVHPNFAADAGRIYISQMTDIDTNFGIIEGKGGSVIGKSGIGIKADTVRVIGRRGVKIVSGKTSAFKGVGMEGEKDAFSSNISQPAPPIELIAGNNEKNLQGVAMGKNTRDTLMELAMIVSDLTSAVQNIALLQTTYNSINALDPGRPWMVAVGCYTAQAYVEYILSSVWQIRANQWVWERTYMDPYSPHGPESRNVFTT
tara:strand:+ start:52475 stop:53425 length:951 start_codon:yes stop_codon:yes gene_type:complete